MYILYNNTLNGNIVAGNENTWHKVQTFYNWSQVNTQYKACVYGVGLKIYYDLYYKKSETINSGDKLVFRPIIEFKE